MNNATTITRNGNGGISSCVDSATFDRDEQTLEIVFVRDGRTVYTFRGVSESDWIKFSGAASLGKAFNWLIKGRPYSASTVYPMALAA